MQLELTLPADDAAKLLQLKPLAPLKAGRPRNLKLELTWQDTQDHALAARALALVQARDGWRLEALQPTDEAVWPPGQPAELREAAADPTQFSPAPTAPVVAFAGRHVVQPLCDGLTLQLLRGELRAVTATQAANRLLLSGPDRAVRDLALTLCESVRMAVPTATLAAQGLALAAGDVPPARRLGAPHLPEAAQGSVEAAFRHVIGHLTDVLLHFAPLAGRDDADTEPVHQMRVAVRRARSAIAIFRPVLDCPSITAAAQTLKTLGQQLAPVRDWDVFVTETAPTLHAMLGDEPHLARLVAAAQRRRHEVHVALRSWLASPAFRRAGIELAWLAGAAAWDDEVPPPPPDGQRPTLPGFAAHVLQRRWKKLLSAGKEIEELDVPALHQVRLRAKRARYAAEIFLPLFKAKEVKRSIRRLSQLQQNLGSLNDAAMAQHLLDTFGGANGRHAYATGLAVGCLAANAARLRPEILRSWDKFARLDPFWT